MAKKRKKSVVWIWRDVADEYCIGNEIPIWDDEWEGISSLLNDFCSSEFETLFPFFTMPPNSLGKITNTANTLTFEIVETK